MIEVVAELMICRCDVPVLMVSITEDGRDYLAFEHLGRAVTYILPFTFRYIDSASIAEIALENLKDRLSSSPGCGLL